MRWCKDSPVEIQWAPDHIPLLRIPQQYNLRDDRLSGKDCGVFVVLYAVAIACRCEITPQLFSQTKIGGIRKRFALWMLRAFAEQHTISSAVEVPPSPSVEQHTIPSAEEQQPMLSAEEHPTLSTAGHLPPPAAPNGTTDLTAEDLLVILQGQEFAGEGGRLKLGAIRSQYDIDSRLSKPRAIQSLIEEGYRGAGNPTDTTLLPSAGQHAIPSAEQHTMPSAEQHTISSAVEVPPSPSAEQHTIPSAEEQQPMLSAEEHPTLSTAGHLPPPAAPNGTTDLTAEDLLVILQGQEFAGEGGRLMLGAIRSQYDIDNRLSKPRAIQSLIEEG